MKAKILFVALLTFLGTCTLESCGMNKPTISQAQLSKEATPTPIAYNFPKVDCKIEKCVALTFDDGPTKYTLKYLEMLEELDVPATFFVTGKNVKAKPNIVTDLSNAGHQIGNHSYDHPNMAKLSPQNVDSQIQKTENAIINVIGSKYKSCFRFPYASIPRNFFKTHPNILHYGWTSDSEDWRYKDPNVQFTKVMKSVPKNGVILFHDTHPGGLTAVPRIVAQLKDQGFTFVTVNQLNLPKGKVNMN